MKADLKKNGLYTTCKYRTVNGIKQLLDGRNRVALCGELDLEVRWERVWIKDEDVIAYIDSMNLHRRHLTPEQRAEVAVQMSQNGTPKTEIAGVLGVHERTVRRDIANSKQNNGHCSVNAEQPAKNQAENEKSTKSVAEKSDGARLAAAGKIRDSSGRVQPATKPPKSGKIKFDDSTVMEWLKKGMRLLGARKEAKGGAKHYVECTDALDTFLKSFKKWQAATT